MFSILSLMCLLSLLILLQDMCISLRGPLRGARWGSSYTKTYVRADANYFGCIYEACYFSGESGLTLFEDAYGFLLKPSTAFFCGSMVMN